MSISSALNIAYSGLSSTSRTAEVISNNVANALTEGYSRRQIEYSASAIGNTGNGVRVTGIFRSADMVGLTARRSAEASLSNTATLSNALTRLSGSLGAPDDTASLAVRFSAFELALSSAANTPDSVALQSGVLTSAKGLVSTFNQIARETDHVRANADSAIFRGVTEVNNSLAKIEQLNADIYSLSVAGKDVAGLKDVRQLLIDNVNAIIPVRQAQDERGQAVLFTTGGEILLNGSARKLEFTSSPLITPEMTVASGALSGLTLNGKLIPIGDGSGPLRGGMLEAHFSVRDVVAPDFGRQIDALALDVITRLQDASVDISLGAADPGLFTDNGNVGIQLNTAGMAGRITINTAVNPSSGGKLWRLRDGIEAVSAGSSGDPSLFLRMESALNAVIVPGAGLSLDVPKSSIGFVEDITSFWNSRYEHNRDTHAQQRSQYELLRISELNATGVDTDREMQNLLLVEQAYAANARIITVIDGLMKTLLEI